MADKQNNKNEMCKQKMLECNVRKVEQTNREREREDGIKDTASRRYVGERGKREKELHTCTKKKSEKKKSQKRLELNLTFEIRSMRERKRSGEWKPETLWSKILRCTQHLIKYMVVKHVSNVNITCGDLVLFARTKTFCVAHHLVYVLINVCLSTSKVVELTCRCNTVFFFFFFFFKS